MKNPYRVAAALAKQSRAYELRKSGKTFDAVAEAMGLSRSAARHLVFSYECRLLVAPTPERPVVIHRGAPVRVIDETFLSVHPRTLLWWEQREQCHRCAWMRQTPIKSTGKGNTGGSGGGMSCLAVTGGDSSCSSARDDGSRCGPDAKLFKPLQSVTKST